MTDMTAEQAMAEYIEGTGIRRGNEWESGFLHGYGEGLHQALSAPRVPEGLEDYDAGLLNDYGGGNVSWWHDYIRYEVDKANDWWRQQVEAENPATQSPAEPAQDEIAKLRERVRVLEERQITAMSNARRMIRGIKTKPNWWLFGRLFGTGMTTAIKCCESMGIDPEAARLREGGA